MYSVYQWLNYKIIPKSLLVASASEPGKFFTSAPPPTAPLELFSGGAVGEPPNDCIWTERMGNMDHMQSYASIAMPSLYMVLI